MKYVFFGAILFICMTTGCVQTRSNVFINDGSNRVDRSDIKDPAENRLVSIQKDKNENLISLRVVQNNKTQKQDVVIAKEVNNTKIEKTFGGNLYDTANSMSISSGNGICISGKKNAENNFGGAGADAWIFLVDNELNLVWEKVVDSSSKESLDRKFGDTRLESHSISGTNDGGCVALYGDDYEKAWITKINSEGNTEWEREFDNMRGFNSIAKNRNGGFAAAGRLKDTRTIGVVSLNMNGKIIWEKFLHIKAFDNQIVFINEIIQDNSDNYIIVGSAYNSSKDLSPFITKINNNGMEQWTKFLSNLEGRFNSVATDKDDLIVVGSLNKKEVAIKFSENGEIVWEKYLNNPNDKRRGEIVSVIRLTDNKFSAIRSKGFLFNVESSIIEFTSD